MSVIIEFVRKENIPGMITMVGTKVFLDSGEEIKDVTEIGMPVKNVNGVLEATITVAVSDISVVDKEIV